MERNGPGGQATVRKIDNISTFLLRYRNRSNRYKKSIFEVTWNISMNPRMSSKLNSIDNQVKKGGRGTSGGGGGSSAVLENLAQESYGIANNI